MTNHATPPATVGATESDRPDDAAAIRAIVADIEHGQNAKDAGPMSRGFAADAVVVTAGGVRLDGAEAILAAHEYALATFLGHDGTLIRYDVTDVRFLTPDVALAHKEARSTALDADRSAPAAGEPSMVAMYVLVRRDGGWWIAARANTVVPAASPR